MKAGKFSSRYFLKRKKLKELSRHISSYYDLPFKLDKLKVEMATSDEVGILVMDKVPVFFKMDGHYFLTLRGLEKFDITTKFVTVDMGAVPFLTKGADVMAPGIVDADEGIEAGDVVWMQDIKNKRPLAVGISTWTGAELKSLSKGKVIKTLHFVGDDLWKAEL